MWCINYRINVFFLNKEAEVDKKFDGWLLWNEDARSRSKGRRIQPPKNFSVVRVDQVSRRIQ